MTTTTAIIGLPVLIRTPATCPDCTGALYQTAAAGVTVFRCRTKACAAEGLDARDIVLEWDESWDVVDGVLVAYQHDTDSLNEDAEQPTPRPLLEVLAQHVAQVKALRA